MWPRYPGAGEIPFGCGINPWGMLALYAPNLQFAWAMEASDGGPSATSIVARYRPEYRISPGSSITWFSGLLISASGLLLIGITSLQWAELQPPGSTLGPPSYVQAFTLRITEGSTRASLASSSRLEASSYPSGMPRKKTRVDGFFRNDGGLSCPTRLSR